MIDRNQNFFNQNLTGQSTECVAITVADIKGNIDGKLYDPDFSYAMTLKLMGEDPTTAGSDPYSGMLSAIAFGCLPISQETFTAQSIGELYVANWKNYTLDQRLEALKHYEKGVHVLDGYYVVRDYLATVQQGVSIALKWYESFNTPNPDGTLPQPVGNFTYHNVAAYDRIPNGILIKPWLGKQYGQNGYVILTPDIFTQVVTGSFAFNPTASRWWNLASIAVTHLNIINDIIPQL